MTHFTKRILQSSQSKFGKKFIHGKVIWYIIVRTRLTRVDFIYGQVATKEYYYDVSRG
jgi:hypothetical protein